MHQLQGNKEYGSEKKGYLLKKSDGYGPQPASGPLCAQHPPRASSLGPAPAAQAGRRTYSPLGAGGTSFERCFLGQGWELTCCL